jgi:hypothetical protein
VIVKPVGKFVVVLKAHLCHQLVTGFVLGGHVFQNVVIATVDSFFYRADKPLSISILHSPIVF